MTAWLQLTPSALERAEVEEEFVRSFERQFSSPLLGSDEAHPASAAVEPGGQVLICAHTRLSRG